MARDFSAQVRAEGEILPRMASALSQGTVDQMYLAVRLAVCELALPADDPIPLVLDDALANFDDERARLALTVWRNWPGSGRSCSLPATAGKRTIWRTGRR